MSSEKALASPSLMMHWPFFVNDVFWVLIKSTFLWPFKRTGSSTFANFRWKFFITTSIFSKNMVQVSRSQMLTSQICLLSQMDLSNHTNYKETKCDFHNSYNIRSFSLVHSPFPKFIYSHNLPENWTLDILNESLFYKYQHASGFSYSYLMRFPSSA